ncbi:unnamed protein product [Acidithrix sp. C25]|nr:unnamed protein product [Acidithrix sp. C25]
MINPGRFNTKELTTLASGIAFIGASTVIIAHSNAKKPKENRVTRKK